MERQESAGHSEMNDRPPRPDEAQPGAPVSPRRVGEVVLRSHLFFTLPHHLLYFVLRLTCLLTAMNITVSSVCQEFTPPWLFVKEVLMNAEKIRYPVLSREHRRFCVTPIFVEGLTWILIMFEGWGACTIFLASDHTCHHWRCVFASLMLDTESP